MVTFETKVWENDWEYILDDNYLNEIIKRCNYKFAKKTIIINNVLDFKEVEIRAKKLIAKGIIDNYYFTDQYALEVLAFFNLKEADFKGGYHYSIAELVSIFLCETPYLLHFAGDSFMAGGQGNWIKGAIKQFTNNQNILVANASWHKDFSGPKAESFSEDEKFFVGSGFSDQCFLIKAVDFKNDIYREMNFISERYPSYGGELFEKRVDSYMRNKNLYRATNKCSYYVHLNWPKNNYKGFLKDLYKMYTISKRLKIK